MDDQPLPQSNEANPHLQNSHHANLLPAVIILALLSLAGIGTSIFAFIQNSHQSDEIKDLQSQIKAITSENDANQNNESKPTDPSASETLYFEPEGWNVKFAYPEGVTNIIGGVNDNNFDGALYIESITKNGKVYDIEICGGKESYHHHHYPFFLGSLVRWNTNIAHEEWESEPNKLNNTLIYQQAPFSYYYGAYGGNGCETGTNPDYLEAVNLVSQLLHSIMPKE